jgi:ribosomal protein S18 acetylase RimI-like enzyme
MTDIHIRQATPDDAAALALVGAATFLDTYAHMIPGADLLAHCTVRHGAAQYGAWLADPACMIWIALSAVEAPIGYAVLTPATLPAEAPGPYDLEVQRIYVLRRYHAAGLGHALMNLAIAEARRRGAPRLVLGVHNDNARALSFYDRQGFRIIAGRKFQVGQSIFCDSVLALPLG